MRIGMSQQDQNKMTPLSDDISNYSTDVETGDNDAHNQKNVHVSDRTRGIRPRKQLWYMLGFVTILVLVAMVVVAVLVSRGSGGQLSPLQQQLSEIAYSISSKKDLQNSGAPQYMAYNWLIHEDTFYNDAKNISRELVAQRYVLAVFYYATKGHQKWVDTSIGCKVVNAWATG